MFRGLLLAGLIASLAGSVAQAEPPLRKLVLLWPSELPAPGSHLFYYGKRMGFYEREGLDLEIRHLSSETLTLRTLVAGEGDIGILSVTAMAQAVNAGTQFKAIAAFTPATNVVLVGHKEIGSAKDLAGHSVAVGQIGAVSHTIAQLMIEASGGDSSKVQWVALGGNSERAQAVTTKKVDSASLMSPFVMRTLSHPFLHVIAESMKVVPRFLFVLDVVRASDIEGKSALFQAYVTATRKTAAWFYQNQDAAIAISQQLVPNAPPGEVAASVRMFAAERHWSADGVIPRANFEFTAKTLVGKAALKSAPSYDDFVLTEFTNSK